MPKCSRASIGTEMVTMALFMPKKNAVTMRASSVEAMEKLT